MNCKHCKAQWTAPADKSLTKCPFCKKPLIDPNQVGNNASPDIILQQVVEQFDVAILGDRRLSAILSDLIPHIERKYKRIFTQAVQDGIGARLLELTNEDAAIRTATIHTLKSSFRQNNGFDHTADYVVDCFLLALGWVDSAQEQAPETAVLGNGLSILKVQLEQAISDNRLSKDEINMLFGIGSSLGMADLDIATMIDEAIKQKGLKPAKTVQKKDKTPKEILCSCDWSLKTFSKTHSKQTPVSQTNKSSGFATIKIGYHIWMKHNLNVDRFRNGEPILQVKSNYEWIEAGKEGKPAWCYYDNKPANGKKYGKLYNWHAINDRRGLAPQGWIIPSNREWEDLVSSLGLLRNTTGGSMLKSSYGWNDNGNGTNERDFFALPGGHRLFFGDFCNIGLTANFWTSNENSQDSAWSRKLSYKYDNILLGFDKKGSGFSIRCIKDKD